MEGHDGCAPLKPSSALAASYRNCRFAVTNALECAEALIEAGAPTTATAIAAATQACEARLHDPAMRARLMQVEFLYRVEPAA
jgi:hypothetical protein